MAAVLSPLLFEEPPAATQTSAAANVEKTNLPELPQSDASDPAQIRKQDLARLRRGRLSTIATGPRGVLAPTTGSSPTNRRSLLGG